MGRSEPIDRAGWRVTRLWPERTSDGRRVEYADTEDFADIKEAWARYYFQCKWSGLVDLYDVERGVVIASNSWPDGWTPDQHERRR